MSVTSALNISDLNVMVYVTSDRQLTREETIKVYAIYVALNPDQQNRRDTEYHLSLPSSVIPSGNDFTQAAFDSLEASEPRPIHQKASSGPGCAGAMLSLGLMGLATTAFVQWVLAWRQP